MTNPRTRRRPAAVATRNGRPAWENAPARLRQSQLDGTRRADTPRPGLIARLFGGFTSG